MTEIKLTLEQPELAAKQLRHAAQHWNDGAPKPNPVGDVLLAIADSIEEQVKPAIEEPVGDTLVEAFGLVYKRQDNGEWWPFGGVGSGYEWPDLVSDWQRGRGPAPVVYRNEVELTELSTEVLRVGIGERPMTEEEIDESQATAQRNTQKWEPIPNRVRRFCSLGRGCRMADGHDGGCKP